MTSAVRRRAPRAVAALVAALVCSVASARAQVDCDRYPAGSTSRNDCYQYESLRARQDLQRAHDAQQRNDAIWHRREEEKDHPVRDPSERDRGAYRFNHSEDDEDNDR